MSNSEEPTIPNRPQSLKEGTNIRVWVVEDRGDIRDLLVRVISYESDLECEESYESAEAMLAALQTRNAPDVILSDFDLGGMTGAESISRVAALAAATRVVIMTAFTDALKETEAMAAGAAGFVLKSQSPGDFAKALRAAAALPVNPATVAAARMPTRAISSRRPIEAREAATAGECETEAQVVGDAIVVWVKRVLRTFGGMGRAANRRSRMNTLRVSN